VNDPLDNLKQALADRYRFERSIGSGGMATVYLAHDIRHEREVAIKVLRPDLAATLGGERFLREIRIAAKLTHPHILPLHDSGEEAGLLYYVMPYIEGESLRQRLTREGELPIPEAVRLLRDVADALASAHKQGIVHRDIKPDNVLLSEGHALVTDFGVAKAVTEARAEGDAGLTTLGMAVGTPAYMSPEQAAGDPDIDHRADIYALGAMAYEMLTGRPPFEGDTPHSVLAAHVSQTPRRVSELRDAVPTPLADVVMRCLAKHPADRLQSAAELRAALDGLATPSGVITPAGGGETAAMRLLRQSDPRRVMGLYGLSAVALIFACYLLMLWLGLPSWALSGTILLLAIGLPVALLTGRAERRRAAERMGSATAPAGRMERWLSWRRAAAGAGTVFGTFAGLVAVYMALRMLGIGPVGTLVASGVLKERDRIVLAEFANQTSDTTLGEAVTQLFRIDLAQSPTVTVLEPVQVERVLARMQRDPDTTLTTGLAMEVAEREGLKAVVSGEILPVGTGYMVSSTLAAVGTGEVLWAGRETSRDASGIIEAVDRLSAGLRAKIGESLRTIRADAPLAQVTTRSTEALRKYAQADRANNEGEYERAIQLLEEAIAGDSSFAMAYRKLGVILRNQNMERDRQAGVFTRAYDLRDRLTERERYLAEAAYHDYVEEDQQAAIAVYRTLLEKYPTDRIALNNLAVAYGEQGRMEEAAELYARSIALGGAPAATFTNVVGTLYALGKRDSAAAILAKLEEEYPSQPQILRYKSAMAAARFQYDSAIAYAQALGETFRGNPMAEVMSVTDLASYALIRGRATEGWELIMRVYDLQTEHGMPFIGQPREVFEATGIAAVSLQVYEDTVAALDTLDALTRSAAWRALKPKERDYPSIAILYADAARPERARAMLAEFERTVSEEDRAPDDMQAIVHQTRGAIAQAEGRPLEAVAEHREVRRLRPACALCGLYDIARAFEQAGEPDSAIAAYELYLDTPDLFRSGPDNLAVWYTYARLGELYEARGEVDRAIEYYNRFVDLWADAETELQPRVSEVRRRLARLAGEPR